MAKLTLDDLANLDNRTTAVSTINANNALIEAALENTLSRDGTSPNSMSGNLDMNSNRILNLPSPASSGEPVSKAYADANYGGSAVSAAAYASSGLHYKFSTTTTDADPGVGYMRANNASLSSATVLYIDDSDQDSNDVSSFVLSWDDISNAVARGYIIVRSLSDGDNVVFKITGASTDNSGYTALAVTYVSGTTSFTNDESIAVFFAFSGADGADGADGAGTGDMEASTYDPATIAEQLVGLTATQTLTNKTLTSPTISGPSVTGTLGMAASGVINFNSGDVTITHATNNLTFAGATSAYLFTDGDIGTRSTNAAIGYEPSVEAGVFVCKGSQYGQPAVQGVDTSFAPDELYLNPAGGLTSIGDATALQVLLVKGGNLTDTATQSEYTATFTSPSNAVTIGSNASQGYIQSWNSTPLNINYAGNTTTLNGNGSGNVSIGHASPSSRLDVSGNIETNAGKVYYSTGGAVTQSTSKSTGVTLNAPSGQITMNASSLAGGATTSFQVTNSYAESDSVVLLNEVYDASWFGKYIIKAVPVSGGGSFYVVITNNTGSAATDAVVVRFVIVKATIA